MFTAERYRAKQSATFLRLLSISMTSIQSIERYVAWLFRLPSLQFLLFLSQMASMQSAMTHAVVTLNQRNPNIKLNHICLRAIIHSIELKSDTMTSIIYKRSFQ